MAAWNTQNYEGSLPLKLYEYMMVNKPIICTVSGNRGGSEIKSIIELCNIGLCVESVDGTEGISKLKSYVYNAYISFIGGKMDSLTKNRNEDQIKKYNYYVLAEKFAKIIYNFQSN